MDKVLTEIGVNNYINNKLKSDLSTGVISIINSQKGQSNGIVPLNNNKKISNSYLPNWLEVAESDHYWDIPINSNESLSQFLESILYEISVVGLYECQIYEWITDGNPNSEYRFVNDLQHCVPLITLTKKHYYSGNNVTGHILTITGALVIQKDADNMLTCYVPQFNEPVKMHQYSIYWAHESQKYWQITRNY